MRQKYWKEQCKICDTCILPAVQQESRVSPFPLVFLTHRRSAEIYMWDMIYCWQKLQRKQQTQVALKHRCCLPEIAQSSTSVCFSNLALCQTRAVCFSNLVLLFVMRWLLRDLYSLVSRCLRYTNTHAFMSLSLNLISHMRFIWVKPDTVTHARQLRSLSNEITVWSWQIQWIAFWCSHFMRNHFFFIF